MVSPGCFPLVSQEIITEFKSFPSGMDLGRGEQTSLTNT